MVLLRCLKSRIFVWEFIRTGDVKYQFIACHITWWTGFLSSGPSPGFRTIFVLNAEPSCYQTSRLQFPNLKSKLINKSLFFVVSVHTMCRKTYLYTCGEEFRIGLMEIIHSPHNMINLYLMYNYLTLLLKKREWNLEIITITVPYAYRWQMGTSLKVAKLLCNLIRKKVMWLFKLSRDVYKITRRL